MSCYLGILYVGCRGVGWQVKKRRPPFERRGLRH